MSGLLALLGPLVGLLKNRRTWWLLAALALVWGGLRLYRNWQHEKQARTIAELERDGYKQLNDSTQAKLASAEPVLGALASQLAAAKALNGQLVAALRIRVPARDTVIVRDSLPTEVRPDSTRVAQFAESTFAGRIYGTVTAPPCCAALGITTHIERPEFSPAVGFVAVGDRHVATVTWAGESAQVEVPYFRPPQKPLGLLDGFVGAGYRWGEDPSSYGQLGAVLRPWRGAELLGYLEGRARAPMPERRWSLRAEFRQFF